MENIERLPRAVNKKELFILTGGGFPSMILNQMIYWSERVADFDKFIEEENARKTIEGSGNIEELNNGWIYKKAEELAEEIMFDLSPQTIRKHLKHLIDNGWLSERRNPKFKWDKTMQYRVNIIKIQHDLLKLGYCLEGYKVPVTLENIEPRKFTFEDNSSEKQNLEVNNCCSNSEKVSQTLENIEPRKFTFEDKKTNTSNLENLRSKENSRGAIPEITTKITKKINTTHSGKPRVVDTPQSELIHSQTNLKNLTDYQKKTVAKWELKLLEQAIETYNAREGLCFAFLAKIYKERGFIKPVPKKPRREPNKGLISHGFNFDILEQLEQEYIESKIDRQFIDPYGHLK